jgi:hypothetical protein
MKQKIKCIKTLEKSLTQMAACLRSYEHYEHSGYTSDLVYAYFHQLMALYYASEAEEISAGNELILDFIQFYGWETW